jgi:hypothetical protein
LDGVELERFLQIKKDFGVTDDAELASFLINRYFKEIEEGKKRRGLG